MAGFWPSHLAVSEGETRAGTRLGVPIFFQMISVASLARIGNQFPCPLLRPFGLGFSTHTHSLGPLVSIILVLGCRCSRCWFCTCNRNCSFLVSVDGLVAVVVTGVVVLVAIATIVFRGCCSCSCGCGWCCNRGRRCSRDTCCSRSCMIHSQCSYDA